MKEMISMQDKLRIETAIKKAAYKSHPLGFNDSVSVDWAEEAIIEERDRATDDCISVLKNLTTDCSRVITVNEIISRLESLKGKSQ